jgi:hypothetical protein
MEMRSANTVCEEGPHWKLSQVSLYYKNADMTDIKNFGVTLEATVWESLVCACLSPETKMFVVFVPVCVRGVDPITLANFWQILLYKAKKTVQHTMQQGVCTVLYPTLSRHSHTNDRMLCCCTMPCNL